MSLNRRDLLKSAAMAAVPGSLLLDAAYGGSPPEAVPEDSPPAVPEDSKETTVDWTYELQPGNLIVFPAGVSKIKIEACMTPLKIIKRGISFDVFPNGEESHKFSGAGRWNAPDDSNMLREGDFWMMFSGFIKWNIGAISDERYNELIHRSKWMIVSSLLSSRPILYYAVKPIEEPHAS